MTLQEAMAARHTVRKYKEAQLSADAVHQLNQRIQTQNDKYGLNMQLVTQSRDAMPGLIAKNDVKGRSELHHPRRPGYTGHR